MMRSRGVWWKKIKSSVALNLTLFLIVLFGGVSTYRTVRDALTVREEKKEAGARIDELVKKKTELEAYLHELETASAAEREAKERLQMKLPGENVVVVVPEKSNNENGTATSSSWWSWIKNIFKKNQ